MSSVRARRLRRSFGENAPYLEQLVSSGLLATREITIFFDVKNTHKTLYPEQFELITV